MKDYKMIKNLVLSLVCTLLFPVWTADKTIQFSNSYFSIVFFVAIFLLLQYCEKRSFDRRMRKLTAVLGLMFSGMAVCGCYLETEDGVPYKNIMVIFSVILFAYIFSDILSAIWLWLEHMESVWKTDHTARLTKMQKVTEWMNCHPAVIGILLLLCWLPCYLATFPGGFRYDAEAELNQAIYGFNGNFPLLHTVIITRLLPALYHLTGTYNTGIGVYVIAQMLMFSAMFTHILCVLYRKGVNSILIGIFFLYYAVFPVIPMLVTQTVRDVLFSALLMYAMFLFYLMTSETEGFMMSRCKPMLLGLVFVLALLARNNNAGMLMYGVIIVVSILVWLVYRKKYLRGASIFAVTTISSYVLLNIILVSLCQPMTPAGVNSSLSVFSQPLVRAYVTEPEIWTEDEINAYKYYFNGDDVPYVTENADPTKRRLVINENMGEFLKFWCKIGIKHKSCYLDAILLNTRQMWFPNCVVDGYNSSNTGAYAPYEKCYYSYNDNISEPGVIKILLPRVNKFYENIGLFISFEKIPVVSMLFSIGFQFWFLLNCVFYVGYRKCRHLYLPLAIILGYMLVSAFVPLVLLRYYAATFFVLPMTIAFTVQPMAGVRLQKGNI